MKELLLALIPSLVILAAIVSSTGTVNAAEGQRRPLVIAHRGFSGIAPENTVASAVAAWEAGADAVEIDIRLTRDGKIVLLHDATTERVAPASPALDPVKTDYAELAKLDAGSWKGPQYKGERLPLLEEVLATIPEGKLLFVEIKTGPEIVPAFKEVIEKYGHPERIVVISFNKSSLDAVVKAMPGIPTAWLLSNSKDKVTGDVIAVDPEIAPIAGQFGFTALDLAYDAVIPEVVAAACKAKLDVYAWTVDDAPKMQLLLDLGVDGITTNRPDVMLDLLGREN